MTRSHHAPGRCYVRAWLLVAFLLAAVSGAPAAGAVAQSAEGAFPVTIEHRYGSTTIPDIPQRVVSVGLVEQDPVLALGVKPVAVTEWFGEQPYAVWPWATDELGDAEPEVLRGELGTPWQKATRVIGRALGQPARAEQLVAEVEAGLAQARGEHPEFEGAAVVFAVNGGDGSYCLHGQESTGVRFLTALGFRLSAEIPEPTGGAPFARISREQIEPLETADVLVWILNPGAEREGFTTDPLYQGLDVVKEGRDLFLAHPEPLAGAVGFTSVLKPPYLLDEFVPMLAAALDGDPTTVKEQR